MTEILPFPREHAYCTSRYETLRLKSKEVWAGAVAIGGDNPIRIQSMTTTPTQDIESTVKQCIALAQAGCEIIRITAQNNQAAKALKQIRQLFSDAGYKDIPLCADIHFLPSAAMEAIEHVEKVRINPGNYADKKKFAITEYSEKEYELELKRLHTAFSPLVLRAKDLNRALRIGTNHGSLSDRIMNRYGDTPMGMVESALEFIRIAESHDFQNIVVSLKASNPKVMIQAYRLFVSKMKEEGMNYPLHLGVTEAGEGEDARIKSAIGIGSLLADGIGDTIRVSLTEDPVYEIPVAKSLAIKAQALWKSKQELEAPQDDMDPFSYHRRKTLEQNAASCKWGASHPTCVILPVHAPLSQYKKIAKDIIALRNEKPENHIEGILLQIDSDEDLGYFNTLQSILAPMVPFFVLEVSNAIDINSLKSNSWNSGPIILSRHFHKEDSYKLEAFIGLTQASNIRVAIDACDITLQNLRPIWSQAKAESLIFSYSKSSDHSPAHSVGTYRGIANILSSAAFPSPIWIRNTHAHEARKEDYFSSHLLESSILSGSLLCDGIGDLISVETVASLENTLALTYNILQGARTRISKTEYVACPSCGRTLFDLQSTTLKIKEQTDHLKGVTIAVMGCIVNGPGEMADADFGYVGGAPGKVNLYVGKNCVEYHIPEDKAVEKLIELIKTHDKWEEPSSLTTQTI